MCHDKRAVRQIMFCRVQAEKIKKSDQLEHAAVVTNIRYNIWNLVQALYEEVSFMALQCHLHLVSMFLIAVY